MRSQIRTRQSFLKLKVRVSQHFRPIPLRKIVSLKIGCAKEFALRRSGARMARVANKILPNYIW